MQDFELDLRRLD